MNFSAKIKDCVKLPNFTIADIYADDTAATRFMMRVGVIFDNLKSRPWITGRNNETDDDYYKDFLLTKVELVDRNRLPAGQTARLSQAPNFGNGPLYLATIVQDKPGNVLKLRQVFLNQYTLGLLNIAPPQAGKPVGDDRKILLGTLIDFTINGQYWGWSRPRARSVEARPVEQELLDKVTAKLNDPTTKFDKSPLPFFAAPLKTASVLALAYLHGAAPRLT